MVTRVIVAAWLTAAGSFAAFAADPGQYRAAHFHADDLSDAGWAADLSFEVPAEWPSGVYGIRLRAGEHEDTVPLIVSAAGLGRGAGPDRGAGPGHAWAGRPRGAAGQQPARPTGSRTPAAAEAGRKDARTPASGLGAAAGVPRPAGRRRSCLAPRRAGRRAPASRGRTRAG